MFRFLKSSGIALAVSVVAVAALFFVFRYYGSFADEVHTKSLAEFDFSSYDFGVVAVAITFAGVYISIVPDKCVRQLSDLVETHFFPIQFQDWKDVERVCHPAANNGPIRRGEAVKCLYAVSQLIRWASLEQADRTTWTGTDGLSAHRGWLGGAFRFFQHQADRLNIATLGIVTAILYAFAPIAYLFHSQLLAAAILWTIYVLCMLEMFFCGFMYLYRFIFISAFENSMARWRDDVHNFMSGVEETRAPNIRDLPAAN